MRAVFVNQCHPDTPHVCAVRLREFAAAMARRGHRVVLLTETLGAGGNRKGASPDRLETRLDGHDWDEPLHVGCARAPSPLLERLHDGKLWSGFRKAVVATSFVFHGGVFAHWTEGSRHTIATLASAFRPDIVWGAFGCTDVWNVARRAAAEADCPWIADIKDNWEIFIPLGLRTILARRYAGAAGFTALSAGHASIAVQRFRTTATVIHSGFPRNGIVDGVGDGGSDGGSGRFRIVASGSIYDGAAFTAIVEGIRTWLAGRRSDRPAELCYFGGDHDRVEAILAPLSDNCRVTVRPFVAYSELAASLARASVIIHPRHAPMLYHHKFIEYLATGQPVLCFPGESAECKSIARQVNGPLFSCDTVADVKHALSTIEAGRYPALDRRGLEAYSWDAQAAALDRVFSSALEQHAPPRPGTD